MFDLDSIETVHTNLNEADSNLAYESLTAIVINPVLNTILELLMQAAYAEGMDGYLDATLNKDGSITFIIDGTDLDIKLTLKAVKKG